MAFRPLSAILAATLAPTLALTLGGCAVVQEKTFGESLDEATAGTQIKTKLFADSAWRRFGEVDVEVADRFVLLSGRVPSETDKADAERIAWTAGSVDEVANELVVAERNLGRDVNDRWITEQVRARIIADREIKGVNYNIQVYAGVVYLMGIARTEDELRRAAEHAARVKGVQKVVSYVKMRDRVAPAPITTAQAPLSGTPLAGTPLTETPLAETPRGLAADEQEAAPIVPQQPTQRGQYRDPYAPGATPPPGAPGNLVGNSGGLESAPLPPLIQP